jgi:Tfp pilus assembly protein PilX
MTPLRSQSGFAMPVVIGVTAIMMLLVGTAVTLATRSTTEARQDRTIKVARQAADAGLELALFRMNQVLASNPTSQPCVTKTGGGALQYTGYATGGEWCAPVSDTLADGTQTTYSVSKEVQVPGSNPAQYTRRVVSSGTVRGETRRVYAEINARRGGGAFGIYGISARDTILFQNDALIGTPTNPVDVRSNGNISMKDNVELCGNVTPGPGKTFTQTYPATLCPGKTTTPATTQLQFPTYDAEHEAAKIANDNSRLGCGGGAGKDACVNPGQISWSPTSRQLTVQGQGSLTLGGNVYSLCRLHLKDQSRLFIAARAVDAPPLRIYIDSPANCPGVPSEQIMIENGGGITNLNSDPVTLQIFVRGATIVDFKNTSAITSATPLMLYAPDATVMLQNTTRIAGGLVGKTVEIKNTAEFSYDPNAATSVSSTALIYQPTQQRECAPAAASGQPPDQGC